MKLCKDCKYAHTDFFNRLFGQYDFAHCRRPFFKSINPVTGKPEYHRTYCAVERENFGSLDTCGSEAKYFEEKK